MAFSDELLDLVNAKDEVIGNEWRSSIYEQGLYNFRCVNLFLRNSQGQLWIPRRTMNKRIFPGCLDFSMGGHVASGESYEQALVRETREELNINLTADMYQEVAYLNPRDHGVVAFMKIYEMAAEAAPGYNPADFCEYFWLTPKALLDQIAAGDSAKDNLPIIVKLLYLQ